MNAREAFKFGYLARCASDGIGPDEAEGRMEKFATPGITEIPGLMAEWAIPALLAAPPVVGATLGYTAAKLNDVGDEDVKSVQNRELVREYRDQTENLNRQRASRDYLQALKRKSGGRPLI